MERENNRHVSIDCERLPGICGDGFVASDDSGSLEITISKDNQVVKTYRLIVDLEDCKVELEADPIPSAVQELVYSCKRAYNTQDLKTAWKFWCKIYDKLDGAENSCKLFKTMRQFTDQQVYDITDYGREHTEI